MKQRMIYLFIGALMGATLFGRNAVHAAELYLKAYPSAQAIYLDGERVELEAYTINGSNYVKLRDVGEAVGFNVYWDGAVQIDSDAPYTGTGPDTSSPIQPDISGDGPYTIHTPHWSREDFSQGANPAVFTGVYDRELYNAIRQTLVDMGKQDGADYRYAYTMVSNGDYSAVKNLLGRMDGLPRYEHHVPANFSNYYQYLDYFAVSAHMPENFAAAHEYIQPIIREAGKLGTDGEKVACLDQYLRSLMSYDRDATAGIPEVFAHHRAEAPGACGSYARAFKFLCGAADIPCFSISTGSHAWNLVYADGGWYHVDVSANDAAGMDVILLESERPRMPDQSPEATAFIKELLVPGSTR